MRSPTMYCPECGAEYEDRVEKCADCDAVLVGEEEWGRRRREDAEEAARAGEMVRLLVLDSPFQRDVLVDALTREGIPHLVREFHDTAYDGVYIKQLGWGEIEVAGPDLARAMAVAREVLETAAAGEDAEAGAASPRGDEPGGGSRGDP